MSFSTGKKFKDVHGHPLEPIGWYAMRVPSCKTRAQRVKVGEDEITGELFVFVQSEQRSYRLDELDARNTFTPLDRNGNEVGGSGDHAHHIEGDDVDQVRKESVRYTLTSELDDIAERAELARDALHQCEELACKLFGVSLGDGSEVADCVLRFVRDGHLSSSELVKLVEPRMAAVTSSELVGTDAA